jgi:hypothetical protein
MRDDSKTDNFILFPTVSGGGCLVRRDQIAGARPNGQDGSIIYLAAGPSVYTSATILQVGRYLGAETAELRRE